MSIKLFRDFKARAEDKDGANYYKMLDYAREKIAEGASDSSIRSDLIAMIMDESDYNVEKIAENKASEVLKAARRKGSMQNKEIYFSEEEMEYIHSYKNISKESVLFVLFCLYKYYPDGFYFKDSTLFSEAKTRASAVNIGDFINTRKTKAFYMDIKGDGMLYKPTDKIVALFNPDNIVLTINNFENIVYYYRRYYKMGHYIICVRCSKIEKRKSCRQKYCQECSYITANKVVHPPIRYIRCDCCGRKFSISSRSKRTLCDECYTQSLYTRQKQKRDESKVEINEDSS